MVVIARVIRDLGGKGCWELPSLLFFARGSEF